MAMASLPFADRTQLPYDKPASKHELLMTSNSKLFDSLDNLLRCPTCFDYLNTAMILPNCQHNYCSLCIRKYFCYKTQCPICSAPATAPELRNNRLIDGIVEVYKSLRQPLKQLIVENSCNAKKSTEHTGDSEHISKKVPEVVAITRLSHLNKTPIDKGSTENNDSDIEIWEEDARPDVVCSSSKKFTAHNQGEVEDEFSDIKSISSENNQSEKFSTVFPNGSLECSKRLKEKPSSKSFTRISKRESPMCHNSNKLGYSTPVTNINNRSKISTPSNNICLPPPSFSTPVENQTSYSQPSCSTPANGTLPKKVECPVCGVNIREEVVNKHLDMCLNKTDKKESLRSSTKKKPLTKLVYNLMSDKDIRQKLKDLGLSTDGERKDLIKRHQEFSLIHNSDCDSLNPTSTIELVKQYRKDEELRQKLESSNKEMGLKIEKDANPSEIRKAQKSYVKRNKSQFDELIKQTKMRMSALKKTQAQKVESKSSTDSTITHKQSTYCESSKTGKDSAIPADSEILQQTLDIDNASPKFPGTKSKICENLPIGVNSPCKVNSGKITDNCTNIKNESVEYNSSSMSTFDLGSILQETSKKESFLSRQMSNSSLGSFDLFPESVEQSCILPNSCVERSTENEKSRCRKALFENPDKPVTDSSMSSPVKNWRNGRIDHFFTPSPTKLSFTRSPVKGHLYVGDSESECGDTSYNKNSHHVIDNSVGSCNDHNSELWPALSQKTVASSHALDSNNSHEDKNNNTSADDSDTASDIIPVNVNEPPSLDSIRIPTRLSTKKESEPVVRRSARRKRSEIEDEESDNRPSKRHKNSNK